MISMVAMPTGYKRRFQGVLETSQAPAIAYSTVLPASYSLRATEYNPTLH